VGVEELVRTFDYKERPQVFEYYPQYYHKTDKVCLSLPHSIISLTPLCAPLQRLIQTLRTAARCTSSP
jgi:hypothetical protein